MRLVLLLTAVAGILGTASAQIPQNVQITDSPRMDSLRHALKLSADMQLKWTTSRNGFDTFQIVDNFNRTEIGPDWAYDGRFWEIVDGEMWTSAAANEEWRYLAVFLPVFNDGERQIQSVSYRWGKHVDALGVREGAMGLMLDSPWKGASGYWLWHRWGEVWLWIIKDGAWEYTPGEGKEVDRQPGLSDPVAGDVVTGVVRNESDAVYFDYYVNDQFAATVKDETKEFPQSGPWYVGLFIHGEQLNNRVDDFTVTWIQGDNVAPAAVTDLRAVDSTASTVKLEWTSTGDNDYDGDADHFEMRYSTSPITAENFSSAKRVRNLPSPAPSGEKQEFTVTGLEAYTTHYFAMKVVDEADNTSPLSNVVQAKTLSDGIAKTLTVVDGCNQAGIVESILPIPLTARVTDANGFAVSNSPVQFMIVSGNGSLDGNSNLAVDTDANGEAKTTWKLGSVAGTQMVEIRAEGLVGSPDTCTAIAKAAEPRMIILVGAPPRVVPVGKPVPQPYMVRVSDSMGNGVVNYAMVFTITAGGGFFLDGEVPAGTVLQTLTDSSGVARARVVASDVRGDTTKIKLTWANSNGTPVEGLQFFVVAAWPDSVVAIAGNNQTAARETALPESLTVQIVDAVNLPVKDYPVRFRVLSGGGALAGNQTQVEVMTDSSGYASTSWSLGRAAGEQQVEAEASFKGKSLRNAPLVFKATATIPSDVQEEASAVPQQFALHQNFPNPFNPETTISFDLPEAGQVEMNVYDMNGRHVRQLLAAAMPATSHRIIWNGQDDNGRPVNSGIYFLMLRAKLGRSSETMVARQKVVLMR